MSEAILLYEQYDFPVFQQRMYASADEARNCPRGDIRLVQSGQTGLVFNEAFRPELMEYDVEYQNEQAHSAVFKGHLEQVAGIVERTMGSDELIEVGCGKAYFLELLQSRGCSIVGFDPTYEGDNPAVHKRYISDDMTLSANGIVLRHVLEHVRSPVEFLAGLRDVNGGGLIYIEVPCFEWIVRNGAWFDIFYEHVNYFRIGDFSRMFGRVVESGHLFGGQYIYVVADLSTLKTPVCTAGDTITLPEDFLSSAMGGGGTASAGAAVWGAASKGVIYALLRERAGNPVRVLIDINPAKWGKYVPATGLRVVSPTDAMAELAPGSDIVAMNSNYLDEIRAMTRERFNVIGVGV